MNNETQKGLTRSSNLPALSTINSFEDLDKIVDYLASSKTYNGNFIVRSTDKDGKTVEEVDKASIANVLLLGNEFGFKPIESILLYRKLSTQDAVVKIHKGRDLGLSPMAALQNIYIWNSGTPKEIVYTGIHVIYKCLSDAGVKKEIIEDGTKPIYEYFTLSDKDPQTVDFDETKHICINTGINKKDLEEGIKSGLTMVRRSVYYRACVKLTRGDESIAIPYTSKQATDAGLYKGINSSGEKVDGKDNWNNHLAAHLVKMSVMPAARMIIGDRLQGSIYISEELSMIKEVEYTDAEVIN